MTLEQFNLLAADEPAPYTIMNRDGKAPILLVFDHAGKHYPRSLDFLGLSEEDRYKHFANDIGIEHIAEPLSRLLDAPLIMGNYSRTVIDLNRGFHEVSCFPPTGDGNPIPGNQNLSMDEKLKRYGSIYAPFEAAMSDMMDMMRARHGEDPIFVFPVHSYTPELMGQVREMEAAILWNYDSEFAQTILEYFRNKGYKVGENDPYDARDFNYCTPDRHVTPRKVHNVGYKNNVISAYLEVRNDLITTAEAGQQMAIDLAGVLKQAIANHVSDLKRRSARNFGTRTMLLDDGCFKQKDHIFGKVQGDELYRDNVELNLPDNYCCE